MSSFIIRGYYGFGNLGDDILMLVTYRWLKQHFPEFSISICSDSENSRYIPSLVNDEVTVIKSNERITAQWIIYGGGGVFFDFNENKKKYELLNRLIKIIGYSNYALVYDLFQRMKGTRGISAQNRTGIGIGVGTYTLSSIRFYSDILSLSNFDFLLVRDESSVKNIRKLKLHMPVHVASDLAFMHHIWNTKLFMQNGSTLQIGFVLRDWPHDNHAYLDLIEETAKQLKQKGLSLKFYSFDSYADVKYIKKFSADFPFLNWNPHNGSMDDFLEDLSSNTLVVTSRAHGAILSACLGIPSVCLGIEPKLYEISGMLSRSARLVEKPFSVEKIKTAIDEQMTNHKDLIKLVKQDVDENSRVINEGLKKFDHFVKHFKRK